jgi:3-isopropylmalate/(R)-2-methylmalate dehydratase small subunit
MKPLRILTSIAAPLLRDNIDTDAIIPSREIKTVGKTGLADGLFAPWRYLGAAARILNPDFILNHADYARAQILLGGANFGCGSSREHAVWALAEFGIRVVIAPSFAPIFSDNCIRNGVLPLELGADHIAKLSAKIITVDVAAQTITTPCDVFTFSIKAETKAMLLGGLDAIALSLKHETAIARFMHQDRAARPWVYLKARI